MKKNEWSKQRAKQSFLPYQRKGSRRDGGEMEASRRAWRSARRRSAGRQRKLECWTAYIDLDSWSSLVGKAKASTASRLSFYRTRILRDPLPGKILHVEFSSVLARIFVTTLAKLYVRLIGRYSVIQRRNSQQLAWRCYACRMKQEHVGGWDGICSKTRSGEAAPENGLPRAGPPMGQGGTMLDLGGHPTRS
jgi:hypothetical protein